jgi:hypothetical protein
MFFGANNMIVGEHQKHELNHHIERLTIYDSYRKIIFLILDTSIAKSKGTPPIEFAIDVSRMRNIAFYMSHSKTSNLMVQFVLLMFPNLATVISNGEHPSIEKRSTLIMG